MPPPLRSCYLQQNLKKEIRLGLSHSQSRLPDHDLRWGPIRDLQGQRGLRAFICQSPSQKRRARVPRGHTGEELNERSCGVRGRLR